MNNCLIMGFGRSGTSLMAGILYQAGYFMGEDLYPPRDTNPKGFFENAFINGINERILMPYDHGQINSTNLFTDKLYSPYHPGYGHRWLSYIPPMVSIDQTDPSVISEIKLAVNQAKYAYKDPRFNYTLNIWKPYLDDKVTILCMFREPEITIQSVLHECRNAAYLSEFDINGELAEELWCNSYHHLLRSIASFNPRQFLFIHYHQLLSGEVLPVLSDLLETDLHGDFIDKGLDRTRVKREIDGKTKALYKELCELANYNPSVS